MTELQRKTAKESLSHNAFLLYCGLADSIDPDTYEMDFKSLFFCVDNKFTSNDYTAAQQELVDAGYAKIEKNTFIFDLDSVF